MSDNSLKASLLEHDMRSAIHDALERRPGLTEAQLAAELDALPIRVAYHVDRLVVCGVLKGVPSERGSEELLFHPSQEELWADERTRILFGETPLRPVALFVAEHPDTTVDRIADAVDRTPETVRAHLETLQQRELVEATEDGSSVRYTPTKVLSSWVDRIGDRYERPWIDGEED